MFIYLYSLKQNHTSNDTDMLIKRSVNDLKMSMLYDFPKKIKILRNNTGKPYIENCFVNVGVTHTADIVIIALSQLEFGIDAESEERSVKQMEAVVDRYFSDRERLYVSSANKADERTSRFLEIWVKKEAYFKCFGACEGGLKTIDTFDYEYKDINVDGYIIYIYSNEITDCFTITDMRN